MPAKTVAVDDTPAGSMGTPWAMRILGARRRPPPLAAWDGTAAGLAKVVVSEAAERVYRIG